MIDAAITYKQEQVRRQCRAVIHMAEILIAVCRANERHCHDEVIDVVGRQTAEQMEILGDILNGMDAVSEDDAWVDPIMSEAQRLWPSRAA